MIGYKDRPKVNADTFDSEGFMHTGDVVDIDDDGYIYVLDRVKEVSYMFHQSSDLQLILKSIDSAHQIQRLPGQFEFLFFLL
jgi:acyl-CoA synthetase (AMP-forming)/AMP-acid ligase II